MATESGAANERIIAAAERVFAEGVNGVSLTPNGAPRRAGASHRLGHAVIFIVHAAAGCERARAQARPVLPFAVEVTHLTDGMVGFLEAPASPSTLDALDRSVAKSARVRPVVL